jgi:hypothetical protein
LWIVYHTYKLLKSQSGTRKGCGAPGWTTVSPPVRKLDPNSRGLDPKLVPALSPPNVETDCSLALADQWNAMAAIVGLEAWSQGAQLFFVTE